MASPKVRLKSKRKIMDRNMIPLKFIPLVLVYLYLLLERPDILKFGRLASQKCPSGPPPAYSIVLDAGSTGSRIHIYRFNYCREGMPVLEDEVFHAIKPGLSSYENKPKDSVQSLSSLMNLAMENVPVELRSKTKLVLKATAGLRLLKKGSGEVILEHVKEYLMTFPFIITHDAVEIMDGKDEGLFAWITVNYLLDNFNKNEKTAGIMDLGGGSTQIVFEPSLPIAEGDHKINIKLQNKTYVLYQRSYLGYGLVEGRKKTLSKGGCTLEMKSTTCINLISSSFDKNEVCSLAPCSFNGVYMPRLEETFYDGDIYAFSYFYDIYAEPFGKVESGFKVGQILEAASTTCSEKPHEETCLDLGFIYSLLRTGYDLPNSRILKTAKKINGIETGWCLGAALAML